MKRVITTCLCCSQLALVACKKEPSPDAAGNEKPSSSVACTYNYNCHNLPATATRTAKHYTGKITQQSSSSFTYKNCL